MPVIVVSRNQAAVAGALADLEDALRTNRVYAELARQTHPVFRPPQPRRHIAFIVATGERSWPGHLWVEREDGRMIRQLVVVHIGEFRPAPAEHPPLGELRSGHG